MNGSSNATKPKTILLTFAAWAASILAVYAAFIIFNIWVLMPGDPSHSIKQDLLIKIKLMVIFAIALVALIAVANWCFKKRTERELAAGILKC